MAIEVDAFLADSIVAVQGKLYALGVGWNRIVVPTFPARHDRIGIGLLFRLPASTRNERRRFDLRVEGPDGAEIRLGAGPGGTGGRLGGEFTAGAADEQIVPIALNLNGMPLTEAGHYRFVVSLGGNDVKVLPFSVASVTQISSAPSTEPPATGTAGYL
jgi:hypothetical protein